MKEPYFEEKFFLNLQNKRWLTSALSIIGGIAIAIFYWQSGLKAEDYTAGEMAVAHWMLTPDDAAYIEMRKAFQKVPALEKKYESQVAQKLFEMDKVSEALSLAHHALGRVEKEAPFHAAYGATTLLIEQHAYQDALEQSVRLKEQMTQQISQGAKKAGALLYAHNLLRIACLQKELNNRPGEKAAWEELESFLQEKTVLSQLVFGGFREKGLDLASYIAERKKQL